MIPSVKITDKKIIGRLTIFKDVSQQTTQIETFATIVKDQKSLTNVAKPSVLDVCRISGYVSDFDMRQMPSHHCEKIQENKEQKNFILREPLD